MSRKVTDLQLWECLMKQIVWKQLGDIRDNPLAGMQAKIALACKANRG